MPFRTRGPRAATERGGDGEAGRRIAAVLSTSWRPEPDSSGIDVADLSAAEPLLLRSGAGGLAWWRLRLTALRDSVPAYQLRQAYRLHALHAALHEEHVVRAFTLLRDAGVEPLLGKGWASARLYPDPGLRPYGDVDLYVPGDEFATARRVLASPAGASCTVDLHRGCDELSDRPWAEVERRARRVALSGVALRIFGPEDHLRLLALHFLRHGAWRPLWLCDVAAALESRPADFDWDYLLSGGRRRSDWVGGTLLLARDLLGASFAGLPAHVSARALPRWLTPAVLEQWGDGTFQPHGQRVPMAVQLRGGRGMLDALRIRWPNAIEASVGVGAPCNEWPRLPFQVGAWLLRGGRFVLTLPRVISASQSGVSQSTP